jgi:hypothetical protein
MKPISAGPSVSQRRLQRYNLEPMPAINESACLAVNRCPDGYEGWTSTHRWLSPIGKCRSSTSQSLAVHPFSTHPVRRCHQTPSTQRSMNSSGRRLPTEESGNGVDKLCPPKETSDRQGSLAPRDTTLALNGSQTRNRRPASGSSALGRPKDGPSSGKRREFRAHPRKVENGRNRSNWVIVRNSLIKTKRIEKLALVVIKLPQHRSPPQRIASEQQNHCSAESPTTFATKS